VVPSLPGYAFSSKPPTEKDFRIEDVARIMDLLMLQLGFKLGYVAQGGDLGSDTARVMGAVYENCKGQYMTCAIMLSILHYTDSCLAIHSLYQS
jgi:microsomal epoxide hydrolase